MGYFTDRFGEERELRGVITEHQGQKVLVNEDGQWVPLDSLSEGYALPPLVSTRIREHMSDFVERRINRKAFLEADEEEALEALRTLFDDEELQIEEIQSNPEEAVASLLQAVGAEVEDETKSEEANSEEDSSEEDTEESTPVEDTVEETIPEPEEEEGLVSTDNKVFAEAIHNQDLVEEYGGGTYNELEMMFDYLDEVTHFNPYFTGDEQYVIFHLPWVGGQFRDVPRFLRVYRDTGEFTFHTSKYNDAEIVRSGTGVDDLIDVCVDLDVEKDLDDDDDSLDESRKRFTEMSLKDAVALVHEVYNPNEEKVNSSGAYKVLNYMKRFGDDMNGWYEYLGPLDMPEEKRNKLIAYIEKRVMPEVQANVPQAVPALKVLQKYVGSGPTPEEAKQALAQDTKQNMQKRDVVTPIFSDEWWAERWEARKERLGALGLSLAA